MLTSCESKVACTFSENNGNLVCILNSESTQQIVQIPSVKSEKGIRKVCFMNDLLFHEDFGPNVHDHFLAI